MALCFPGSLATQTTLGVGVLRAPLSSVFAVVWGCPAPHLACFPACSPDPLRFRHMAGEVTPAEAEMSLGAAGPAPLSDQVASVVLRE